MNANVTKPEFLILMKAAQIIEDAPSLAKGRYWDLYNGKLVYCKYGAVSVAALYLRFPELSPVNADPNIVLVGELAFGSDPRRNGLLYELFTSGGPHWNDAPTTTKEMVVESLRKLAMEKYAAPEMLEEIDAEKRTRERAIAGRPEAERDGTPTEAQPRETPQAYVEASALCFAEEVYQVEFARAQASQAFKHVRESDGISQDQP